MDATRRLKKKQQKNVVLLPQNNLAPLAMDATRRLKKKQQKNVGLLPQNNLAPLAMDAKTPQTISPPWV